MISDREFMTGHPPATLCPPAATWHRALGSPLDDIRGIADDADEDLMADDEEDDDDDDEEEEDDEDLDDDDDEEEDLDEEEEDEPE